MNQDQLREIYQQYFYYILLADVVIGLIFGAVPLIVGIRKKQRNLGLTALLVSGAVGAASPILSLVAAVIFTVIIVRKGSTPAAPDAD